VVLIEAIFIGILLVGGAIGGVTALIEAPAEPPAAIEQCEECDRDGLGRGDLPYADLARLSEQGEAGRSS
jgi:hypothetical protein